MHTCIRFFVWAILFRRNAIVYYDKEYLSCFYLTFFRFQVLCHCVHYSILNWLPLALGVVLIIAVIAIDDINKCEQEKYLCVWVGVCGFFSHQTMVKAMEQIDSTIIKYQQWKFQRLALPSQIHRVHMLMGTNEICHCAVQWWKTFAPFFTLNHRVRIVLEHDFIE